MKNSHCLLRRVVSFASALIIGLTSVLGFPMQMAAAVGGGPLTVKGYGPPNGQNFVPLMAPIDIMFSSDPDPTITFPLVNTDSSVLSIVDDGGTAVTGSWNRYVESFGEFSFYRVTFATTNLFTTGTEYTVSLAKSAVGTTDLMGGMGMAELDNGDTAYSFTFTTTDSGGGEWQEGQGFQGDMGGSFPPMANLAYPMPRQQVQSNIQAVNVKFDRPMDATTFDGNISIKKVVNGTETDAPGTVSLSPTTGTTDSVYISGYSFANSNTDCSWENNCEWRVVVSRDVKDTKGTPIAGMPTDEGGNTVMDGRGFGFSNMGPFKESFYTDYSSSTVTAALTGVNLDKYRSGENVTNVPTSIILKATFSNPLDPSTVTDENVTFGYGDTLVEGTVSYKAEGYSIEFDPDVVLTADTEYTFEISTDVHSITGQAISAYSDTFTTGVADVIAPKLVYAEADNYGLSLKFNEPLGSTAAANKGNYTLKTCSQAAISGDGVSCTGGGSVIDISLLTGVNLNYNAYDGGAEVWMEGLTLTPGDGFYIAASSNVKDVSDNAINANYDTWTGIVMDSSKFAGGGQGMFNMKTMGMEDFNMNDMGMKPIMVAPKNRFTLATSKYEVNIPLASSIASGGYIELTFPSGFNVAGAKKDSVYPSNTDFNGPSTGTVTFGNSDPAGATYGYGGGGSNDGIATIVGAQKIIVSLNGATQSNDVLQFGLDGIINSSESSGFTTSGYQVEIKTYGPTGTLLEGLTSMPFFLNATGNSSLSGRICAGACTNDPDNGLNGVTVYLNDMTATTANDAAGGGKDGEFKFENLPDGWFNLRTDPNITVDDTDYYGMSNGLPVNVSGETTIANLELLASNGDNAATLPVTITVSDLDGIANLGLNDSIDIFASNSYGTGFVTKTLTRDDLEDGWNGSLFLPSAGTWRVGVGPAVSHGDSFQIPEFNWMTPPPAEVMVSAASIGSETPLASVSFSIGGAGSAITGKVVDSGGNGVSGVEVNAFNPQTKVGAHASTTSDGTFSLGVNTGSYVVMAAKPGLPATTPYSAIVTDDGVFINGSSTESTGGSGENPFLIKFLSNTSTDFTITGRVTDGTNIIANAGISAYRTDAPSPDRNARTDSSGNYTLYVPAGTWVVKANAPGFGYLGSKTLAVSASVSGQNFQPSTTIGSISGTINIPGTSDDSGVMVSAYSSLGENFAATAVNGTYTINSLPYSGDGTSYTVMASLPGGIMLAPLTVTVNGAEVGNNFTVPTYVDVTLVLSAAVSSSTMIDFNSSTGMGRHTEIPAGETTTTISMPEGTYNFNVFVPGVPRSSLTISGENYNSTTKSFIVSEGDDETLTVTLPTLYTVTGRITSGGNGLNNVFVNVIDVTAKQPSGTLTSNDAAGGGLDGEFSLKLPVGTYDVTANAPGYSASPTTITVSGNSSGNNLSLTAFNRTISGTVSSSGSGTPNADIWARKSSGEFSATRANQSGVYSLPVNDGTWTVYAGAMSYNQSDALSVTVNGSNVTSKNFTLTRMETWRPSKLGLITPSSGGSLTDNDIRAKVVVPPNAFGSSGSSAQLSAQETNAVFSTPTGAPLGGKGRTFLASDASGSPITTFQASVEIALEYLVSELADFDPAITTKTQVEQISNGYWDETSNEWVVIPTVINYYDEDGGTMSSDTVLEDLSNVYKVAYKSTVDHFTTFAPIIPSGATPPAAPTGLASTSGSGQVTLTWNKNSEEDMASYNIWENNVTEGVTTTLAHSACGETTCTKIVTDLSNGVDYSFQIVAVDEDGNTSEGSDVVEVTLSSGNSGGGGGSYKQKDVPVDTIVPESPAEDTSVPADDTPSTFVDTSNHWAKKYIEKLYDLKIVNGYLNGNGNYEFKPDNSIARAELAKIAVTLFKIQVLDVKDIPGNPFNDFSMSKWYAPYVYAASENGVVSGYKDNNGRKIFKPLSAVTRVEALKMLIAAAGVNIEDSDTALGFTDVDAKGWYIPYIKYALTAKVVDGYADGTFKPNQKVTRAELSKMAVALYEFLNK